MIAHDLALALMRYDNLYHTFKPRMTVTQFIVMGALQGEKTHAQAHVAQKTGLAQEVVRFTTHQLHRKKFIRRTITTGFKAGRPIAFTDAGIKAYEDTREIIRRADQAFFGGRLIRETAGDFTDYLQALTT